MNTITIKQSVQVNFNYSVLFTRGTFEPSNKTLGKTSVTRYLDLRAAMRRRRFIWMMLMIYC
jgi:hypothetical protein